MTTQDEFIARQSRRRRRGRIIPPVVDRRFRRVYPVTTPYRKESPIGRPWSLGYHTGEDHACPDGSLAVSVSWGRVMCVAEWFGTNRAMHALGPVSHWGESYGTHVVIRTATGLWDVGYCHLSEAVVKPGQSVKPGQVIGRTGHTGGSGKFGPHLHFEVRPANGRFGTDVRPINAKRIGGLAQ